MRFRSCLACLVVGLLALAVCSDAAADDVTTSGGKKLNGKLVAVDAQGVTFSSGDSKLQISARDIVVVDLGNKVAAPPKEASLSEIELTDGSTFRCTKFVLKGKQFEADLTPGPAGVDLPKVEMPMSAVFSVMKKADDLKVREAWKKMLATRGKRDLYVIATETGFTFRQGTILAGGADEKARPVVNFESDTGAKDELQLSRAAGLVFYQPQPASIPVTLCKVTDVYGNALTATSISLTMEGVTVVTVAGATVWYPSAAALVRLDYALGNVAYLSDLDPQLEVPEVPAEEKRLNPTVPYLKDRSLANEQIKLDNLTFPKGVCIAPDTVATFNLNSEYTQFKATVGIDENGANATSAARVTVEADGQVLFSELVKRKDKPKGLVLAVKGVKQLRIIVEADTPLNGNYVTLADARVQK
ncbi:MAG: NPCBM/NEW2 domain-containing protein [Gemmata sp.]